MPFVQLENTQYHDNMGSVELPPAEVAFLDELRRDRSLRTLRARIQDLRGVGWSLQSIADGLRTYRSTVRAWELHPDAGSCSREVPTPPPETATRPWVTLDPDLYLITASLPLLNIATLAPRLSLHEAYELGELSAQARRVRGHTASAATSRVAAASLNSKLLYQRTRGVTVQDLAEACDLTSRAVRSRIPRSLPAPVPIDGAAITFSPLIVIWEAPSNSRKWQTFVELGTKRPVAFPTVLIEIPSSFKGEQHLLTPAQAESQLGWPRAETLDFPTPTRSFV